MNLLTGRRAFYRIAAVTAMLALLLNSGRARAQESTPDSLKGIGIDQNLGAQVPADLQFRDETGDDIKLGDYFGKRPIILTLVYYDCPMLCTMALNDLTRQMNGLSSMRCGKDYDVISVSFNPDETPALAAKKKASYLHQCIHSEDAAVGWHFLTGTQDNIKRLTDIVGFHYRWEPATKSYSHAAGLMILRPDGKVSRYFYGTQFEGIELKGAMQAARAGEIGKPAIRILLYCFQYDPATGRVGLIVTRAVRVGGILTVLALGSFVVVMLRRDHRRASAGAAFPAIVK